MDKRYSHHSNLFQSAIRIHSRFSHATLLQLIDCHHLDQELAKKNDISYQCINLLYRIRLVYIITNFVYKKNRDQSIIF